MLTGIESPDLARLSRELSKMDADFAKAVRYELREPVRRVASDMKFSARTRLPKWAGADAAAGVTASSTGAGYYVKSGRSSRFSQGNYVNKTGNIRHPLFGNRDYWFDTPTGGGGWWDQMAEQVTPRAMDEFTAAVLKILDRLRSLNFGTSKVGRSTTLG